MAILHTPAELVVPKEILASARQTAAEETAVEQESWTMANWVGTEMASLDGEDLRIGQIDVPE